MDGVPNGVPLTLHDEFLGYVRDNGMEQIAKDSGVLQNGQIVPLADYYPQQST